MAGAGAITGVLLSSSGYIANHTQSDSALLAIKACYLYIPALLIRLDAVDGPLLPPRRSV